MKRIMFAIMLILGMSLVFASCEKTTENDKLIGTWDFVDEPGDYVVITDSTFTFFYSEGGGDNGVPYKYSYEHPHIYISGVNLWDVVSISTSEMVWESKWDNERVKLKKR